MSRYLLTGATGFLGYHLALQLLNAEHEVVALCRKDEPKLKSAGCSVRIGDVLDSASVKAAAKTCDGAFHCAGLVSRDDSDAEAMFVVHVDGTQCTLDALRDAGVPRVVVASTSGVIAVNEDPAAVATEDDEPPSELIARWPYFRSKQYAEQAAMQRNGDDFSVICVNPSLLLGPGDERQSSTEDVVAFLRGQFAFCPPGGMAFVDVRDAATAFVLAMDKGAPGRRYLINAANMTIEAFFGRLSRISGKKAPTLVLPQTSVALAGLGADLLARAASLFDRPNPLSRVSAEMAQHYWYCDASRAKTELGWSHRDPGETLSDTVDDLRQRGVVWPS